MGMLGHAPNAAKTEEIEGDIYDLICEPIVFSFLM